MGMKFVKSSKVLGFKEGKPTMYQIAQLNYGTIDAQSLIDEAARSCSMNKTMMKAALEAIVDCACHYLELGYGVNVGDLGTVKPIFTAKMQETAETLSADNVKAKKIRFYPGTRLKEVVGAMSVSEYELSDSTLLDADDADTGDSGTGDSGGSSGSGTEME